MRPLALALALASAAAVDRLPAQSPPVALIVSDESAPPNGWAQFKFTLARPAALNSGSLRVEFDPAVFDAVESGSVFGANGDETGFATVAGTAATITFTSAAGGVGRVRDLPAFTLTAHVRENVAAGTQVPVTVAPNAGTLGGAPLVVIQPGTFTVAAVGALTVRKVWHRSPIVIVGEGFGADTQVSIEGVPSPPVRVLSPTRIEVLANPDAFELTGKRITLRRAGSAGVALYSSDNNAWTPPEVVKVSRDRIPLFGLVRGRSAALGCCGPSEAFDYAIDNPNDDPVTIELYGSAARVQPTFLRSFTIPPRRTIAARPEYPNINVSLSMTASAPVRVLFFSVGPPPVQAAAPQSALAPRITSVNAPAPFRWRPPAPLPAPQRLLILGNGRHRLEVDSAAPWLTVSLREVTACAGGSSVCPADSSAMVGISSAAAGLAPGDYEGVITATPAGAEPGLPARIPVALTVLGPQSISVDQSSIFLSLTQPATVNLTSSEGSPVEFTVEDLPDWLEASATKGTTPAALMFRQTRTAGAALSSVAIRGAFNRIDLKVNASPSRADWTDRDAIEATALAGGPDIVQTFTLWSGNLIGVSMENGAGWLQAAHDAATRRVVATLRPGSLAPGDYRGVVNLRSPGEVLAIPVRLLLLPGTRLPSIQVSPPSLELADTGLRSTDLQVTSEDGSPVEFTATAATLDGNAWLSIAPPRRPATPQAFRVTASDTSLATGTWRGQVIITAGTQTVGVPVTFKVSGGLRLAPLLGWVTGNRVAPRQIVTLHGVQFGPRTPVAGGSPAGSLPRVRFDGVPAHVLFASSTQINAVVPDNVAGNASTRLEIDWSEGLPSNPREVAVVRAAPEIFTQNGTGLGQAAVLNQDNSLNGAATPAPRESVIQIFATGTGLETATARILIGGVSALVTYAGPAPGLAQGVVQINALVPSQSPAGSAIPVVLEAAGASSASQVTIAVR